MLCALGRSRTSNLAVRSRALLSGELRRPYVGMVLLVSSGRIERPSRASDARGLSVATTRRGSGPGLGASLRRAGGEPPPARQPTRDRASHTTANRSAKRHATPMELSRCTPFNRPHGKTKRSPTWAPRDIAGTKKPYIALPTRACRTTATPGRWCRQCRKVLITNSVCRTSRALSSPRLSTNNHQKICRRSRTPPPARARPPLGEPQPCPRLPAVNLTLLWEATSGYNQAT